MDFVTEAMKSICRAQDSGHPDEKAAHLNMAERCLSKVSEERADGLVAEAMKSIWRAQDSSHPDETAAHLNMAETCLSKR
jgi:hypothetical protein